MRRPKLEPASFFSRIPLAPHQLTEPLTPRQDVIVLCHLGVPRIPAEAWSLTIDGLVSSPKGLKFPDLRHYPQFTVQSIHQCAGSPLAPKEPKRRIVNVQWTGIRLADVLNDCGIEPSASYVWSSGADYGEFGGVAVDRYMKDLPLSRLHDDVLIATEMNGSPLSAENGFPARLVVPGFYGTNSVKWLTRLTLADRRADSPFTTRWYNDPVLDREGNETGTTTPVWEIAPESVIVFPAGEGTLRAGEAVRIWGWAWSDAGVAKVEIRIDDADWQAAALEKRSGRSWQRFSATWTPQQAGSYRLSSRASNQDGLTQPEAGRRNAIYSVDVRVVA